MNIHEITRLSGKVGSTRKRIGRGIGSGHGKTSGRGHKGAGSRSGTKKRLASEGGQMPMFRRVAKRGFSRNGSIPSKFIAVINIGQIENIRAANDYIDREALISFGLIPRRSRFIKVLGGGEVKTLATVRANYFTRSAVAKIESSAANYELV